MQTRCTADKQININIKMWLKDDFFTELPPDIVERLVTRPEDIEPNVLKQVQVFKEAALRILEVF